MVVTSKNYSEDWELIDLEVKLNRIIASREGTLEGNIPLCDFISILRRKGFDRNFSLSCIDDYINLRLLHHSYGEFEAYTDTDCLNTNGPFYFYAFG